MARLKRSPGATLVEMGLLIALIAILALATVRLFGREILCLFERSSNTLASQGRFGAAVNYGCSVAGGGSP
jgi:Flp pilus assembly pilin Flp